MDYSIVIPVFNKADLTKRCLDALPATIADAGTGEVIVVDNASSDHTASVLAAYPWIRLIRNEENLGFAGANNQAAREARGDYLVLLNNDTEPWSGWLASMLRHARTPGVGAVGARLLYPDKTCQHGGVVVMGNPFGRQSAQPYHHNWTVPFEDHDVRRTQDMQIVTGACLVTPRDLYARLGGLDEGFWNGYEDVDYCLKVRREGLRVVYDADAVLYHFESQSGIQRFRKAAWNTELLERHWRGRWHFDALAKNLERQQLRYPVRDSTRGMHFVVAPARTSTVIVHGAEPPGGRAALEESIRRNNVRIDPIVWATGSDALERAREAMRVRGRRFAAFVHGGAQLEPGWLDELLRNVMATPSAAFSTYSPELPLGENIATLGADGRCAVATLGVLPQHVELQAFDTLEGSIADLSLRVIELGYGTRGVARSIATLPPVPHDAAFERRHGRTLRAMSDTDPASREAILLDLRPRERGLVSIVTLSWNAPNFTKLALASIASHTSEPYEVVVVDNGSGPETLEMLAAIDDPHVRIVYNETNRGFGGGNNDGIAVARGDFVVILNNDVIVTDGWLDALLAPFDRIRTVGVTAPRTNRIVGDQQVVDATYADIPAMHAYAARRRQRYEGRGYTTDRAIGFCLCVDRRVIDAIGGFDERFVLGNFEDDDFSLRVRAAGYEIYVCNDAFIHHFGSESFKANNVDYTSTMQSNWAKFAQKWGYPPAYPTNGYEPRVAIVKGFDRALHYAALPPPREAAPAHGAAEPDATRFVFACVVENEAQWTKTAAFVRRYFAAFGERRDVALAIGATGEPVASTIGARVARVAERAGVDPERCADVDIADIDDVRTWRAGIAGREVVDVEAATDRSPSALRRRVDGVRA